MLDRDSLVYWKDLNREIPRIDPKIKNLVLELNHLYPGITDAACEGHLDGHGRPYPWIGFTLFMTRETEALNRELLTYNVSSDVKWTIEDKCLRPSQKTLDKYGITRVVDTGEMGELPPKMTTDDLIQMQLNTEELANFLMGFESKIVQEKIEAERQKFGYRPEILECLQTRLDEINQQLALTAPPNLPKP